MEQKNNRFSTGIFRESKTNCANGSQNILFETI